VICKNSIQRRKNKKKEEKELASSIDQADRKDTREKMIIKIFYKVIKNVL
jgi:hypothetical protein